MKFSWSLLWMKVSVNIEKEETDNSVPTFQNDGPYYKDKNWTYPQSELIRFKKFYGSINMKDGNYTVDSEFWSPSIWWGGNIWRVGEEIQIKNWLIIRDYWDNSTDYYGLVSRSFKTADVSIK